GPQPPLQLFAGHDVAWPLEHHPEDLEWLLLQADPAVAVVKLARTEVQFERSEAKRLVCADRCFHGRPRVRVNTGPYEIMERKVPGQCSMSPSFHLMSPSEH